MEVILHGKALDAQAEIIGNILLIKKYPGFSIPESASIVANSKFSYFWMQLGKPVFVIPSEGGRCNYGAGNYVTLFCIKGDWRKESTENKLYEYKNSRNPVHTKII
jgi:hypothetical protein